MNIRILCAIAMVALLAQCAKKEDEKPDMREQQALDAWMAENNPQAERQANGMYVEWLRRSETTSTNPRKGEDWVWIDYLVRDLAGDVVATRDEQIAKWEGTFTRSTHYGPEFTQYDPDRMYLTEGEYEVLGQMSEDDSVRIYLPSRLAYRSGNIKFGNGYQGSKSASVNLAVMIDLCLSGIVFDPEAVERAEATAFAEKERMILVSDTIPGLFYKYLEPSEAKIIPADSAVYAGYTGRFLDGKLIATNDPATALAEWGDFGEPYVGSTFFSNKTSIIMGKALRAAINHGHMRYDSKVRLVLTSEFGYGDSGMSASSETTTSAPRPVIYPYTPLTIDYVIRPEEFEPEE